MLCEVDVVMFEMEWLPNHSELRRALEVYGFLLDFPSKSSTSMEFVDGGTQIFHLSLIFPDSNNCPLQIKLLLNVCLIFFNSYFYIVTINSWLARKFYLKLQSEEQWGKGMSVAVFLVYRVLNIMAQIQRACIFFE